MKTITLILCLFLMTSCNHQKAEKQTSTIDDTLQSKVTSILDDRLKELNASVGQVIVMDVQTGEIKALVGLERKDSLTYEQADYFCIPQPTELFKTISLLATLENGTVHLSDKTDTGNGILELEHETIRDHNWRRGGYGEITALQGFARYSNIATALCVKRAFPKSEDFYKQLERMSVCSPDSIERLNFDAEVLYVDCNYINAANGFHKYSPIQTLTFYNAIANNGTMVLPHLYKDSTTIINRQIASPANIDSIKYALRYTITDGLGKRAFSDKVQIAGYAGTIQLADESYIADFCGYFPADKPQYSIIVSINKGAVPVSGGAMAGSTAKEIAEYMRCVYLK